MIPSTIAPQPARSSGLPFAQMLLVNALDLAGWRTTARAVLNLPVSYFSATAQAGRPTPGRERAASGHDLVPANPCGPANGPARSQGTVASL